MNQSEKTDEPETWNIEYIENNCNSETKNQFLQLQHTILECSKCNLSDSAKNKVIGKGSLNADIVFIGEAPGKNEDQTGIPFCGAAGKKLDMMIEYMNLTSNDYAVINTLKCRPPNNRTPYKNELQCCKPYLDKQLDLINPKLIILLGNTAERTFEFDKKIQWGETTTINDMTAIKLFHPAAMIYDPEKMDVQKKFIDNLRPLI